MLITFFFVLFLVSSSSTLPLNDFFPFGHEVGDSNIRGYNTSESLSPLPYIFPYFDNIYRQIWITNNGLFSFLLPDYYLSSPALTSLTNNSCVVAGFWLVSVGSGSNRTENKVYYQMYSNISSSNSTVKVFNKASSYVRNFFPQQRPFNPKLVITGTSYYISIDIGSNGTNSLNNTFQIVLCTDEDRSFVFFLYHDLQWSDPYNSTYYNYNAQAGFRDGDRNITVTLPYSGTADIVKLVNESNVNVPGLFAFRVDADVINTGGCNESVSMISFRPRISPQFGSTPLTIYGPCFTNETKVKCRFGSPAETVDGIVVDRFRATCLTPFSSVHGSTSLNVSIDNGQTFIPAGTFTYAPLQFGSDEVAIEIEGTDNLLNVRHNVTLKWYLSEMIRNALPNGTKIDIELWKVSLNDQLQLQKDNQSIILRQNLDLIDSITVQLLENILSISTCFIRVVARFNSQVYAGLNTGLLIVKSHPSLAAELCQNWVAQQPEPSTWNNDGLLSCPMTRWQAIAAGRCCYQSDRQCYRGSSNPYNCWLHRARSGRDEPSAVDCYVSIAPNRYSAGAECCYDKNETLITRGTGAGTDDRYQLAVSPVRHIFHDTLPYLQCCMMSTDVELCNKYMYYRPPRRGSNTMGESGRMWGDPHFGTLDGMSYTFNGYGEYTYLAISNDALPPAAFDDVNRSYIFMSQIRTIPLSTTKATVTKGFAACFNKSKTESISLTISRREHLILRRENEILEFEENIDTLFFPELTITRLDRNNNSHFSLAWIIGVTIEINVIKMTLPSQQLVLNIAASVAGSFRGKTYGLLGTYDGTAHNDLRSKNGTIISSNASLEQIHKDFGVTWAIEPSKSLFYYESNQSAEFFQQKNRVFIPSFIDPIASDNSTIRNTCKINLASSPSSWNVAQRTCYYDLFMTNDKHFAQISLDAGNELLLIRENQKNPPLFDLSLPLSMNLKHGQQVNSIIIKATSGNQSHVIELSELHRPVNSTFDRNTGVFNWTAIKGEHYLSIRARDTTSNLTSKHDIVFNVNATDEPIVNPTNGGNSQFHSVGFIVSILGIIIRFYQ